MPDVQQVEQARGLAGLQTRSAPPWPCLLPGLAELKPFDTSPAHARTVRAEESSSPEARLSWQGWVELPQSTEGLQVPGEPKASPVTAPLTVSREISRPGAHSWDFGCGLAHAPLREELLGLPRKTVLSAPCGQSSYNSHKGAGEPHRTDLMHLLELCSQVYTIAGWFVQNKAGAQWSRGQGQTS